MTRWAFLRCLTPAPQATREALAEALMALSSSVAIGEEGVWLEVGRSVTLFGSEEALSVQARALAELLEQVVLVAIADRPETARLLALRSARPLTRSEPGRDAEALSELPVEALGASPSSLAYLRRLGVRDAGALSRLASSSLRRRLGAEGERLVRLARAEELPLPVRHIPPEQPSARRELEPPLPPEESLLFIIKAALDELTTRLAGRGLTLAALRLTLAFEGGARREEELLLPRPLRATAPLLAILRERLFGRPPDEADGEAASADWPERITTVEVRALRTAPAPQAQLSLLSRAEVDSEQLAALLARLTSALGVDKVFAAELVPSHLPEESWRRLDFAAPTSESAGARERPRPRKRVYGRDVAEPASPRPVLVLPEPLPLRGELLVDSRLSWDGGEGVVGALWGPERLRGQWWSAPFDRDYYVVDLRDGARIWTYWDRRAEALFLQGLFD